jgi:hypothetical protein
MSTDPMARVFFALHFGSFNLPVGAMIKVVLC